jgi:polyvinyl alcohol dehydrogenase (cytochrome)
VTVANGVVYAGSMAQKGNEMYALDAATGRVLWSFSPGQSVIAAPAVAGGSVYWGSGYAKLEPVVGSGGKDEFYAFSVRPG